MRTGLAYLLKCLVVPLCLGAMSLHAAAADVPGLARSEALALVRATFIRLNDANQTSDYGVLRAMAAPDFQQRFTAQKLEKLFAGMRAKKIDLSRALTLDPVIETARFHTGQHILQFAGYLPTVPVKTRFGFSYQKSDGVWRLYGLTLDFDGPPALPRAEPST